MASAKVLSATIEHEEEAKHEPINKCEETKKDVDIATPPPPPPPPPPEHKHADPETELGVDVTPEPETLPIAFEAKAVLADEPLPVPEKKVVKSSTKVAPEPTEDKAEVNAEVVHEEEPVVEDGKDEEEKLVEEEEKVTLQATVEKKEE